MTREGHTWAVITKKKNNVEQQLKNVVEQVKLLTVKWITIELRFKRCANTIYLMGGGKRTETSDFADECGEPS